jgi:hypothetical protein
MEFGVGAEFESWLEHFPDVPFWANFSQSAASVPSEMDSYFMSPGGQENLTM